MDRLLEAVIALLGDEEVRGMEDEADLAFAAERLGHQMARRRRRCRNCRPKPS